MVQEHWEMTPSVSDLVAETPEQIVDMHDPNSKVLFREFTNHLVTLAFMIFGKETMWVTSTQNFTSGWSVDELAGTTQCTHTHLTHCTHIHSPTHTHHIHIHTPYTHTRHTYTPPHTQTHMKRIHTNTYTCGVLTQIECCVRSFVHSFIHSCATINRFSRTTWQSNTQLPVTYWQQFKHRNGGLCCFTIEVFHFVPGALDLSLLPVCQSSSLSTSSSTPATFTVSTTAK